MNERFLGHATPLAMSTHPGVRPTDGEGVYASAMASQAVPLMRPKLPDADALMPYLRKIDACRWYTNFGPLVSALEQRFIAYLFAADSCGDVVTLCSGTAALEFALSALRLPKGARVLVPALTFVATATAILRAGLEPVIIDIDPESWSLTPALAEAAAASIKVDAVVPVATFGMPQPVQAWDDFMRRTGIPVLVDAAGAFGNQSVGECCHVAFSLHATKSLAAGEGGLVASSDLEYCARIRQLSNFGIDLRRGSEVYIAGGNGKLSEYHAAIAHASMDRWPSVCADRQELRVRYIECLREHRLPLFTPWVDPSWIFPLFVAALPYGVPAVSVKRGLETIKIQSRQWYCPTLDCHPAFSPYQYGCCPVSRDLSKRLLGLPFFADMTEAQVEHVCGALKQVIAGVST